MKIIIIRHTLNEWGRATVVGVTNALGAQVLSASDTLKKIANTSCKEDKSIICSILTDEHSTFKAVTELAEEQDIEVVTLDYS